MDSSIGEAFNKDSKYSLQLMSGISQKPFTTRRRQNRIASSSVRDSVATYDSTTPLLHCTASAFCLHSSHYFLNSHIHKISN
ncbi:hypothetical protein VNO78_23370 [Psophocarpus tetragonolobus]|uniref:Uncharacterized protein n=1 Tax=Psophocarpus tetragonolobus TaxID=3891 RepID=A0AAN9S3W3_PSOTE